MKPFKILSKEYFTKLPAQPVVIIPFNPQLKLVGKEYIKYIDSALSEWHVSAKIIGSTAYEIAGKEGIEIGIFLNNNNWNGVINRLENYNKHLDILERDFAQFYDEFGGYKIDIIIMRGHAAVVNKAVYHFFIRHPEIVKKYEAVKKKFSYSKREYQIQKNEFINDIIEDIPDEDFYTEKYEKDFDI